MEQYTVMVPIVQETPDTPHQVGSVEHLNPAVGTLQVSPPVGRGDKNTSATGRDHGRTPGRVGDSSGSA